MDQERRPATLEEARAVAHPLRLQILRLCLDEACTNKQLADRLERDPGTVLHHVRTLVDTGFLAVEEVRTGVRGALEKPYRATGKSWRIDVSDADPEGELHLAMVDALREELLAVGPAAILSTTRLGVRLGPDALAEFKDRFQRFVQDLHDSDDPTGTAIGFFGAIHERPVSERDE